MAVISGTAKAPALTYLRNKLQQQLQAQIELLDGATAAFQTAITALDTTWKRIHPFHLSVLEGINGISICYVDKYRLTAYLASYGTARAVAGGNAVDQKATVTDGEHRAADTAFAVEAVPLDSISHIVVGSSSFW